MGSDLPWYMIMCWELVSGFFYVYQIIDAMRTREGNPDGTSPLPIRSVWRGRSAQARRLEGAKIPTGAAILIGLGVLFLLHTAGFSRFGLDRSGPLILIVLGVWLFAKNWGLIGANATVVLVRALPHPQVDGPGHAGHSRRAVPAGQRLAYRIRQNLARDPVGDRRREADAEQRFVRRTRRAAASGSSGYPPTSAATARACHQRAADYAVQHSVRATEQPSSGEVKNV